MTYQAFDVDRENAARTIGPGIQMENLCVQASSPRGRHATRTYEDRYASGIWNPYILYIRTSRCVYTKRQASGLERSNEGSVEVS